MEVETTTNLAWEAVPVRGVRWTAAPARIVAIKPSERRTVGLQCDILDGVAVATLPTLLTKRVAIGVAGARLLHPMGLRLATGAWAHRMDPCVGACVACEATAWVE